MIPIPTEQRILDSAQALLQIRGYNGFSYKDIAEEVNIKTSSIHYHFATKQLLVEHLFKRYSDNYFAALDDLAQNNPSNSVVLSRYCDIFEQTAKSGKFCMCASLAAVHYAIPASIQIDISRFTRRSELWIQKVLQQGIDSGEFILTMPVATYATVFFAALEGALMLCQSNNDGLDGFKTTANGLVNAIAAA